MDNEAKIEHRKVDPPRPGGRQIQTGGGRFVTFTEIAQELEGTLIGQVKVRIKKKRKPEDPDEIDRWTLLLPSGDVVILPNHYDLDKKLGVIAHTTGLNTRVWIAYEGRQKVSGVAQPMVIYNVQDYGLVTDTNKPEPAKNPPQFAIPDQTPSADVSDGDRQAPKGTRIALFDLATEYGLIDGENISKFKELVIKAIGRDSTFPMTVDEGRRIKEAIYDTANQQGADDTVPF